MSTWEDVNSPPEPVLLDVSSCCIPTNAKGNPIDAFYDTTAHILTLGSDEALSASPALGRLLILGLVTGTEAYFRAVLLGVTTVCPLVRESISDHPLAFGAVDFYGLENMALGLFEGVSFAGSAELKKRTKQLTGLVWPDNSSLGVAVEKFDQVCHLRHAAVHAQGVLNRGNARALGLVKTTAPLQVVVDLPHLHLAAKACTSLVKAYNVFLYKELLQRWLNLNILTGNWQRDRPYFHSLFELFRSSSDGIAPKNSYVAYKSFLPKISSRLAAGPTGA